MKYTIVSAHRGIHGSFLNLLDLTDYLIRRGNKVDFVCLDVKEFYYRLNQTVRDYKLQDVYDLKTLRYERLNTLSKGAVMRPDEIVIIDFKTLFAWPKPIKCGKLVILDNAELSYHLNGILMEKWYEKDIVLERVLQNHSFDDHCFAMPHLNWHDFKKRYPFLKAIVFYKKINIDALRTVKTSNNGRFFYRGDNPPKNMLSLMPKPEKLDDLTKMFDYAGYVYYRRQDRAKFEQLGRMVFEFIILNKRVYWYDMPDDKNDGLADYWQHYGSSDRDTIIEMMLEDYENTPW